MTRIHAEKYSHYAVNVSDTAHADGEAEGLLCPEAGIVQLIRPDGTQVPITVVAGQTLKLAHTRIEATGTTVADQTLLIALYTRKP